MSLDDFDTKLDFNSVHFNHVAKACSLWAPQGSGAVSASRLDNAIGLQWCLGLFVVEPKAEEWQRTGLQSVWSGPLAFGGGNTERGAALSPLAEHTHLACFIMSPAFPDEPEVKERFVHDCKQQQGFKRSQCVHMRVCFCLTASHSFSE